MKKASIAKIEPVYEIENAKWHSFYERAEEMFKEIKGINLEQIILDDRDEHLSNHI